MNTRERIRALWEARRAETDVPPVLTMGGSRAIDVDDESDDWSDAKRYFSASFRT